MHRKSSKSVRPKVRQTRGIDLQSDDSDGGMANISATIPIIIDPKPKKPDIVLGQVQTASIINAPPPLINIPKVSNADIMNCIKSMESRVEKLEAALAGQTRLIMSLLQSSPTFLSAGKAGTFVKTIHMEP